MIMKLNCFLIPLAVVFILVFGSWLTSGGMDWYATIRIPDWTPPGSFIGAMWTLIFSLTAISATIVWNNFPRGTGFLMIIRLFTANAVLNVFWSYLFFNRH